MNNILNEKDRELLVERNFDLNRILEAPFVGELKNFITMSSNAYMYYVLTKDKLNLRNDLFYKHLYLTKTIDYKRGKKKTALHFDIFRNLVRPMMDKYYNKIFESTEYYLNLPGRKKFSKIVKDEKEKIKHIQDLEEKQSAIESLEYFCLKPMPHLIDLTPKTDNELMTIKSMNAKASRRNAEYKLINNFFDVKQFSFLTLTLSTTDKQGQPVDYFHELQPVKELTRLYLIELRQIYKNKIREQNKDYLKQYSKQQQNKILNQEIMKRFKNFRAFELQENGNWHIHFIINCDLKEIFGFKNKYVYSSNNSEFFDNQDFDNDIRYQHQQWWVHESFNTIIPNVISIWYDIVKKKYPNLKPLNPRSQALKTFNSLESKKVKYCFYKNCCLYKQSTLKAVPISIFVSYLTTYVSKMENMDEMFLDSKKKRERLFIFSRGFEKPIITREFSLFPYDFSEAQNGFCLSSYFTMDILKDFEKEHYIRRIVEEKNLLHASKYYCFYYNLYENTKEFYQYHFKSIKYKKLCQRLLQEFNLDKMIKKVSTNLYNATDFNNLKNYFENLGYKKQDFNFSQEKKNNYDKQLYLIYMEHAKLHNYYFKTSFKELRQSCLLEAKTELQKKEIIKLCNRFIEERKYLCHVDALRRSRNSFIENKKLSKIELFETIEFLKEAWDYDYKYSWRCFYIYNYEYLHRTC